MIDVLALSRIYCSVKDLEEHVDAEPQGLVLLEVSSEITIEVLGRVVSKARGAGVILWAGAVSTEFLSQSMGMGVRGVIFKSSSVELHAECLKAVASGQMWVERGLAQKLLRADWISLTPRERQLMGLIAQGLANKEIAWSMDITEGTVKVYLSHLFAKVGATDRFQLALIALKNFSATQSGMLDRMPARSGERAVPLPMPKLLSRERLMGLAG
jgi:DNA-binding NarL/FixJ family response regulator